MDDLISRQAAIEAIASRDETDGTVKVFTGREVNEILSALPSAERPTGKWISQRSKDWSGGGAEICAECGYGYSWGAYHEPDEFKFCPNCGAKMEGDKDGSR